VLRHPHLHRAIEILSPAAIVERMKNESFTPPPNRWMSYIWRDDRVELVLIPVGLYLVGLFTRKADLIGWAFGIWALGFLVWCLWTTWRVSDRQPRNDVGRAVATLVYGGLSWPLLIVAGALPSPWGLALGFPLVFAPNVWGIVAARRWGLEPLPHGVRALRLYGAVFVCAAWIALSGLLVWAHHTGWNGVPDFDWLAWPVIVINLIVGGYLLFSASRGFSPPLPMTTEAILARAPRFPPSP